MKEASPTGKKSKVYWYRAMLLNRKHQGITLAPVTLGFQPERITKHAGIINGFPRLGKWLLLNVICQLFQRGNHSKREILVFQ